MKSPTPPPALRPPPGPRWILAGLGLLFLSWLVFMGYYVWKVRRQPPPVPVFEPPPAPPPGR